MPIFEYACAEGHVTEVIQLVRPLSDTVVVCGTCGGTATKVEISRTSWTMGRSEPRESKVGRAIRQVRARS